MAWTLTYVAVAVIATVIVFVASARLGDERRPVGLRTGLSLVAGVGWPVILLGLAEFTSFAAYAKVHEHDDDQSREAQRVAV